MFKVMIVDDMEILRREVKRLKLWGEASGFMIAEEAENGLDALHKLESGDFDLIITDIRMPKMDGIELLHRISENKLCPVTVLLSDFTEYTYARKGFLYGAFDYLGKPVNEKELAELLARVSQHLHEIHEEERKNREIQELAEDTQLFSDETKQVIIHIQKGSGETALLASNLIEMIYNFYPGDHFGVHNKLNQTMHKIIDETRQTYQWLDMYIDIDELTAADYLSYYGMEEIKKSIIGKLENLNSVIHKLMGSHNGEIVKQTCEYVLMHVDDEISVTQLSEKLFVNKSYLGETFKKNFGMNLLQYINMVKMERAKKLLHEGNLKTYQVAGVLGFKDSEYFGRLFKKHIGVLPSYYIK